MTLLAWSSALGVGVASIDAQHERLVALLNELHDAIQAGHEEALLLDVFDELNEYTTVHFAYEEALLAEHGYPEGPAHSAQHRALLTRLTELRARFGAGGDAVGLDLAILLRDWVKNHLAVEDQRYAAHLRARGVQ